MNEKDMFYICQNDDGTWSKYDDTYDISIHCKDQEERGRIMKVLDAAAKQMEKEDANGTKGRQVIATWYTPEEKLPDDDGLYVVTFSGTTKDIAYSYSHALGVAMCCYEYEDEDSAWWIQGLSIEDSFKMHVEAWCDLDVYI